MIVNHESLSFCNFDSESKLSYISRYSKAHDLLIKYKVKKDDLEKIVSTGNIKLR